MNMWEYIAYRKPFIPFFFIFEGAQVSGTCNNATHYEDKNIL
jgi:hypothetical protein